MEVGSGSSMGLTLQWFLRAIWIATTLPILLALFPFPGSARLRRFLTIFGNRGKTVSSSVKKLLVPQSYFKHFYMVGVIWNTVLLISMWHAVGAEPKAKTEDLVGTVFMLLLLEIQVLRRLYESHFVFDYSNSARLHAIGYLVGLCYYVAAPLSIFLSASAEAWHYIGSFPSIVGNCSAGLSFSGFGKPLIKFCWYQWIGAAVWLWGSVHQYRCHSILGSARKQDGAEKYVIARGDWFELVSCPHYLAEIVIYAGILVFSGGSDLTMWLLFAFVVANLSFAAAETHDWYRRKFDDYPSSRRAIFPLIF